VGVKPSPGTADVGAAVTLPDTEVAGGLDPTLADCVSVFQSLYS